MSVNSASTESLYTPMPTSSCTGCSHFPRDQLDQRTKKVVQEFFEEIDSEENKKPNKKLVDGIFAIAIGGVGIGLCFGYGLVGSTLGMFLPIPLLFAVTGIFVTLEAIAIDDHLKKLKKFLKALQEDNELLKIWNEAMIANPDKADSDSFWKFFRLYLKEEGKQKLEHDFHEFLNNR